MVPTGLAKSGLAFSDHCQNLIRATDAGHTRKNRIHEGGHGVFVRVATGVAHDNDVVIEIACRINRSGHPDIDGAARNDNRVDPSRAQRQVEIGLMKGAPAVLWNDRVLGPGRKFFNDFLFPGSFGCAMNRGIAIIVGPRAKAHPWKSDRPWRR